MPKYLGVREPHMRQAISLRKSQVELAKRIVIADGHGNLSRLFQDLLDAEAARRRGASEPPFDQPDSETKEGHAA